MKMHEKQFLDFRTVLISIPSMPNLPNLHNADLILCLVDTL